MRVLVLNASPKGEQSHTMAITRAFLSGFPEGTQTELLELRRLNIRPLHGLPRLLDENARPLRAARRHGSGLCGHCGG